MSDLWAALCLVLVIEGLLLFVAPATWKQAVTQLLEQPDSKVRIGPKDLESYLGMPLFRGELV